MKKKLRNDGFIILKIKTMLVAVFYPIVNIISPFHIFI
jgi:hypothetical protein